MNNLCLSCARAKLAGEKIMPQCRSCAIVNQDPLGRVRALAAQPSLVASWNSLVGGGTASHVSTAYTGGTYRRAPVDGAE